MSIWGLKVEAMFLQNAVLCLQVHSSRRYNPDNQHRHMHV
jgi:hypothetical protein